MSAPTKVLLTVDDDKDLLAVIQMSLQLTVDWTVLTANSGYDGLSKAAENQLDAILLDVEMPRLDGISTLQILRMNPRSQHIPVVFVTGTLEPVAPSQMTALGVQGIIHKPFDGMTLADQIATILRWRQV